MKVWTSARDGSVAAWKLNVKSDGEVEIEIGSKWESGSPIKCACLMSDGSHICTGSFDGEISMWNIQVLFFIG